jgi:lysophospholipase L1-like esterase
MFRNSLRVFMVLALVMTMFAQIAQAKDKTQLVALGDSISFGWDLAASNDKPSPKAFPSLMADEEHLQLRNLSVGGHSSVDLLALLQTKDYRKAVRHADFITLEIGSNDFLHGASPIIQKLLGTSNYNPSPEDIQLLGAITGQLSINLAVIISEIRSLTEAPIILYNIYNPFFGMDAQAGYMLAGANQVIKSYDADPSIAVVDAFSAFAGRQNMLLLPLNVHPNETGQAVLAKLGIQALDSLAPADRESGERHDNNENNNNNRDHKQAS